MSFLEEIKDLVKQYGNNFTGWEVVYDILPNNHGLSPVSVLEIGSTRWDSINLAVYQRNDELVGIQFLSGLTEIQDDEPLLYNGEVYVVEPFTVTRYRKA